MKKLPLLAVLAVPAIVALSSLSSSDVTAAQDDKQVLAKKAKAILQSNCYRCHGQGGRAEHGINYMLDRDRLVAQGKVKAGDAKNSRLIKAIERDKMPPDTDTNGDVLPRVSKADLAVLRQWIDAGAPDFDPPVAARKFLSPQYVVEIIHKDVQAQKPFARKFTRYFTLTHLYNAGLADNQLQTYRLALSKLVNSLSWGNRVVRPEPIDAEKTIFRIDLRHYRWNEKTWERVVAAYPYGVQLPGASAKGCAELCGHPLPYVRGDWFVVAASRPPLYHEVLDLPGTDRELEKQLKVDVSESLRQRTAVRVGFNGSGVSQNNRLLERHETGYGAYWRSYDFAGNKGDKNLFDRPLGAEGKKPFKHDGGEIIFNLPNGLQAYMLTDGKGKRIDKGPIDVVSDPGRPDRAVLNGISCMSCHHQGMIAKDDQVRAHVEANKQAFDKEEVDAILGLYSPKEQVRKLYKEDAGRYARAVKEAGGLLAADGGLLGTDPVVALVALFERDLDEKLAAAEAGVEVAALRKALDKDADLARTIGVLKVKDGRVKREVFVDIFADLAAASGIGSIFSFSNGYDLTGGFQFVHFGTARTKVVLFQNVFGIKPGFARVYDLPSGKPLTPPMDHTNGVVHASFSPDGSRVVTASRDNTARVWDAETGKLISSLLHEKGVSRASFSPDSRRVVTASYDDKTARVWDAETGKPLTPPLKHDDGVHHASFSPDGRRVVTASSDKTARVWDAETGKPLAQPLQHEVGVGHACFSPNGRRIVTASGRFGNAGDGASARVWDAETGKPITPPLPHGNHVEMATFSADGRRVLTASVDKTARVWDAETGSPITPPLQPGDFFPHATFSPTGRHVATSSGYTGTAARIWDAETGKPITPPLRQGNESSYISFTPDGRRVVTCTTDGTARIWDARTGKELCKVTITAD